jgi:hypothetical protein
MTTTTTLATLALALIPSWIPEQMHPSLQAQSFVDKYGDLPWLEERIGKIKADADAANEAGSGATPEQLSAKSVYQMALMAGVDFALAQLTAFAPPRRKARDTVTVDPWARSFLTVFEQWMADHFESALYQGITDFVFRCTLGKGAADAIPNAGVPDVIAKLLAEEPTEKPTEEQVNALVFAIMHGFGSHSKLIRASSKRTHPAVKADGTVMRRRKNGEVFVGNIAYGVRISALQGGAKKKAAKPAPKDESPAPTETPVLPTETPELPTETPVLPE